MKKEKDYDLVLNWITAGEMAYHNRENWDDYKKMAHLFLNHKGSGMFEDEIRNRYSEGVSFEKILSQNKEQYIPGANRERNGKREQIWYDIYCMEVIEPQDDFFSYFFIVKLRHISLLEIDHYLNYHLEKSFDNDRIEYLRFLNLSVRENGGQLLSPEIKDTINEWVNLSNSQMAGIGNGERSKTKLKREPSDNLTKYNLQQTALLVHFMQEGRIILKDEYLNKTQAGQAFSILTGYSPDALRQELKPDKLNFSKGNLTDLSNGLTNLIRLINNKMREK